MLCCEVYGANQSMKNMESICVDMIDLWMTRALTEARNRVLRVTY